MQKQIYTFEHYKSHFVRLVLKGNVTDKSIKTHTLCANLNVHRCKKKPLVVGISMLSRFVPRRAFSSTPGTISAIDVFEKSCYHTPMKI
jgi:hypothetical protein